MEACFKDQYKIIHRQKWKTHHQMWYVERHFSIYRIENCVLLGQEFFLLMNGIRINTYTVATLTTRLSFRRYVVSLMSGFCLSVNQSALSRLVHSYRYLFQIRWISLLFFPITCVNFLDSPISSSMRNSTIFIFTQEIFPFYQIL